MSTTVDLLEMLKARHSIPSDYKLAKYLGVTHQTVYKWKNGLVMSSPKALALAEELGLDLDAVYLSLLLDKAKDERERKVIESLRA